jgi:malate dehydrogenase (oxaloacetate-decarboxylating)(NADP+)
VLNDAENPRVLNAARILREEGICEPVLLGNVEQVNKAIAELRLEDELKDVAIWDPHISSELDRYAEALWKLRQRRGVNRELARMKMQRRGYYGSMMVHLGEADGFLTGLTHAYSDAVRPPLEVIRAREGRHAGGVYVVVQRNEFKFLADCTVNPEPSPEALAEIAIATADLAKYFDVTPRVAFLSYSNFGDANGGHSPSRMRTAANIARTLRPDLEMDGEMQVDAALVPEERASRYAFSHLSGNANVLVFPSLDAANISYKLLWRFGGGEVIGPILLGMNKAVNVLQQNAGVQDIVNLAAVTALRAQGGDAVF